jgi:nucleoside-diphosphate-sugar epimerase
MTWLGKISNEAELEDLLSQPSDEDRQAARALGPELLVLGAAGKMGPSLAHRAVRAGFAVTAVSRFGDAARRAQLEAWGVRTIARDLLAPGACDTLPDAPNVIFMAAKKFGTAGDSASTWAINGFLPGLVAQRYRQSRIVAFSSGNVYPLTPIERGGSVETDEPDPVGEYAQSVVARERTFEYFSKIHGTPVCLLRLNYAVEMRYGVLVDLARKVWEGRPVDLAMGYANVIWQGDATSGALRALGLAASPPAPLNLTGPELLSVRWLAARFGELLGKTPVLEGEERETALLSNAARCHELFGDPQVPLDVLMGWVADWVMRGGASLNKPTHFEVRDGRF